MLQLHQDKVVFHRGGLQTDLRTMPARATTNRYLKKIVICMFLAVINLTCPMFANMSKSDDTT